MAKTTQDVKIVVDLETTGLDYKREKIIEFAGVKLVDNKIVDELELLIDPKQEIRKSSIEIHGITQEMVDGMPTIEEVMPQIKEFIQDYPLVAHNAIFDHSFLNQANKDLYGEEIVNEKIDTFQMFREVFPDERSHGMEALMNKFNIDFSVRHRAMADAKGLAYAYPHLKDFYNKKLKWQLSQLGSIEYMFERYLRLQSAVHTLHAEMADLKSLFKIYFQENGKEITSSTGEILTQQTKLHYGYDYEMARQIINEAELQERAYKLNTGYVERLINDPKTDEELRQKLMECRIDMRESQAVQIVKPEKVNLPE